MQNLGQTWIFNKSGYTHLTQTKCDPDDPDDLTQFQPWYILWGSCYNGPLILTCDHSLRVSIVELSTVVC